MKYYNKIFIAFIIIIFGNSKAFYGQTTIKGKVKTEDAGAITLKEFFVPRNVFDNYQQ